MKHTEIDTFKPLHTILLFCFGIWMLSMTYLVFNDIGLKPYKRPPLAKTNRSSSDDEDRVEKGIHVQTGLVYAEGFDIVRGTCTACHSAKLVTQNRATREGWLQMIEWMQATQGLWDLGKNEPIILNYLAKHYAPKETGRRKNINIAEVEWYILELEE